MKIMKTYMNMLQNKKNEYEEQLKSIGDKKDNQKIWISGYAGIFSQSWTDV